MLVRVVYGDAGVRARVRIHRHVTLARPLRTILTPPLALRHVDVAHLAAASALRAGSAFEPAPNGNAREEPEGEVEQRRDQ